MSNSTADDDKTGLCWAACGAMIGEYFNGEKTSAYILYSELKEKYGEEPIGTDNWINKMYDYLGLNQIYYSRKLSYNEVVDSLKKNKPIHIRLQRYVNGEVKGTHGVVLCGTFYYLPDCKYYYVYRDSNVNGYVVNSIISYTLSTTNETEFYYKGANFYNNWTSSRVVFK